MFRLYLVGEVKGIKTIFNDVTQNTDHIKYNGILAN
ncbi:unnamed protein product [Brassica oleracea var. botrytis]